MSLRLLKSTQDHRWALDRLEEVWHAKPGSEEGEEAAVLVLLIAHFEKEKFLLPPPSALAALQFRIAQMAPPPATLTRMFGTKKAMADMLSGKAPLTAAVIRKLHTSLGIPLHVLLPALLS